jgi:hypothetical protein
MENNMIMVFIWCSCEEYPIYFMKNSSGVLTMCFKFQCLMLILVMVYPLGNYHTIEEVSLDNIGDELFWLL